MKSQTSARGPALLAAAARGAVLGLGGVMTADEKLEQTLTGRPDSYVPARTLLTPLGRRPADDATETVLHLP